MIDAETAQSRLRALLDRNRPPTGGVDLADIVRETSPLLPLLSELPDVERASGDYDSFQFRECLTVMTLLGRRLALLDLTPTAAVQIVQLALRSAEEDDALPAPRFAERAVAAVIEGFVMGREERVLEQHERRASLPLAPIRLDEGLFALVISGVHDAAVLREQVDALGRAMLDADAEFAIVDLSQLGEPNRERAAAMLSADEVVRMLGGRCFFSGVDTRWQAAIAEARIDLAMVDIHRDFTGAMTAARAAESSRPPKAPGPWRRLLGFLGS
ncbi:MAG: hypothetical protein AAF997_11750 [Myxococcota bacterium]